MTQRRQTRHAARHTVGSAPAPAAPPQAARQNAERSQCVLAQTPSLLTSTVPVLHPLAIHPRQVLQGKVQVRTRHREAFAVRLEAASRPSRSSSVEEGRLSEGGQDASEEEMLALFNSIDVDGSGRSLPEGSQRAAATREVGVMSRVP